LRRKRDDVWTWRRPNDDTWRPDCLAGHVRLELRNVGTKYPFERSHRFPGIQPNFGDRDRSRLSCEVGDTQLVVNARISAGDVVRALGHRGASLRWQELPRFWADPEMIRRPIEQRHCALCAGLSPQRERVWWHGQRACGFAPLPRQRLWASAGFRWWRRDIAPG
jgi:hypothetical protein